MEKKGKKEEPVRNKTVDVVADSNYSIISPEYNKAFRAWRNNEKNEYAFRCRKREGEAVYVEGVGYHAQDPAAEERRAMIRINMIIGIGMLFYLLIEHLLPAILMSLVHLLGVDVSYCYSDGTVYGNQMVVLVILMLKTLLKYLVPICIFRRSFRMPRQVAYHLKPVVPRDVPISTFVTLVVFAVANVWLLFSPINVLRTSTLGSAYYTVSYMDHSYQIIYLLFELFMVCVMQEVLIHGDMLHVLRQFGDWHADYTDSLYGGLHDTQLCHGADGTDICHCKRHFCNSERFAVGTDSEPNSVSFAAVFVLHYGNLAKSGVVFLSPADDAGNFTDRNFGLSAADSSIQAESGADAPEALHFRKRTHSAVVPYGAAGNYLFPVCTAHGD